MPRTSKIKTQEAAIENFLDVVAPAKVAPPAPLSSKAAQAALDLTQMTDADLIDWTVAHQEELDHVKDILQQRISAGKFEVERRIRERAKDNPKARAIPHPRMETVELQDDYTPYKFDHALLQQAKALLKPEEAAKVGRLVPEETRVIPEHFEPGNVVSIKALADKYDGSDAGKLLKSGMTRERTGDRLVWKVAKAKLPAGGTA